MRLLAHVMAKGKEPHSSSLVKIAGSMDITRPDVQNLNKPDQYISKWKFRQEIRQL